MNKISKKIVALVTMAAFVLTLVPAAAFAAAEPGDGHYAADVTQSGLVVAADNSATATVAAGDQLKVALKIQDKTGAGTNQQLPGATAPNYIKVWATTKDDEKTLTNAVDFTTDNEGLLAYGQNDRIARFEPAATVGNNTEFYLTFDAPGTYVVYTGVIDTVNAGTDVETALGNAVTTMGKTITVTVTDPEVTTSYIDFSKSNGKIGTVNKNNPTVSLDLTKEDFKFNGTDTFTINGTAYEKDGTVASYDTFNVSTNKDSLIKITSGDTVTAKNDGTFSITFTMEDTQNGYITLSNDDVSYSIYLIGQTVVATDINTTVDGGYVLAGTDGEWKSNTDARYFTDAVQFELKDAKGNVLTGDGPIAGEPAASEGGAAYKDAYINITSKPEKSTLTSDDLQLVWNDGVYTLYYRPEAAQAVKDLIPGKYTVNVALADGDHATASFNVAEFGTVKDLVISLVASDYNGGNEVAVSDKVTLGQKVVATAKYVDENGLKIVANNVNVEYGFDGKAVYNPDPKNATFATAFDTASNESLLGTTINVKAYDNTVKKLAETELTVVDSYNTYSLAFDSNNGEINNDNTVKVSVVDEDGNVAKVSGDVYAYVEDQSVADAKVSADVANKGDVTDGKAELTLYADQETTADIRVVVVTNDGKIYAGTLEYAFGSEDLLADRSVVMTIGSTEYVVNNNIIKGDAAPFVNSDYRTMVPIRALAESFDAEVNYDNDARTVTIKDGDNTIVMTIDKDTYTVNGEEKTMDTAAVIGEGDRAYVPVRFAAEALGYTVTPLYDSNNLTASVVFQR